VQYLLLVFTIFEILEGPINGGNELETSNCKDRHNKLLKNIVQHRDICLCNNVRGSICSAATVHFPNESIGCITLLFKSKVSLATGSLAMESLAKGSLAKVSLATGSLAMETLATGSRAGPPSTSAFFLNLQRAPRALGVSHVKEKARLWKLLIICAQRFH
jgi:hypothetical protein